MADYTVQSDSQLDPDAPLTSELAYGWRDNLIATAEGAVGAPVIASGWHPYDMLTAQDGNDGVIYDVAVSGAMTSLETPDFEDGFEYRLLIDGASGSVGTSFLRMALYKETSAGYSATFDMLDLNIAVQSYSADIIIRTPRLTAKACIVSVTSTEVALTDAVGSVAADTSFYVAHTTPQKILRAQFTLSTGTMDAGKISMYRRLVY